MPDELYWDKLEDCSVILPSDYFRCNRCFGKNFIYEPNELFLSKASKKKYKQICVNCGEVFFSDKKYTIEEVGRYCDLEPITKKDNPLEVYLEKKATLIKKVLDEIGVEEEETPIFAKENFVEKTLDKMKKGEFLVVGENPIKIEEKKEEEIPKVFRRKQPKKKKVKK